MKIGILSDTHNNLPATRAALELFRAEGVRRLYHCGDITAAPVVMLFVGWDVHFVWGNVDHDRTDVEMALRRLGLAAPRLELRFTLDGHACAMTHGHMGLDSLIASGQFRYVFHGHTHTRRDELIGSTRVINPGALGGRRPEDRSVAVLDVDTDTLRFLPVPEPAG